jgi:hypothetical protein
VIEGRDDLCGRDFLLIEGVCLMFGLMRGAAETEKKDSSFIHGSFVVKPDLFELCLGSELMRMGRYRNHKNYKSAELPGLKLDFGFTEDGTRCNGLNFVIV